MAEGCSCRAEGCSRRAWGYSHKVLGWVPGLEHSLVLGCSHREQGCAQRLGECPQQAQSYLAQLQDLCRPTAF